MAERAGRCQRGAGKVGPAFERACQHIGLPGIHSALPTARDALHGDQFDDRVIGIHSDN
jgi:hypothetical protein